MANTAKTTGKSQTANAAAPAAGNQPDTAAIIAAVMAALGGIPAPVAAPAKAAAKSAAVADAPLVLDFSVLRQSGKSRASSTGKSILVPVAGTLPNGAKIGGTLWVKA